MEPLAVVTVGPHENQPITWAFSVLLPWQLTPLWRWNGLLAGRAKKIEPLYPSNVDDFTGTTLCSLFVANICQIQVQVCFTHKGFSPCLRQFGVFLHARSCVILSSCRTHLSISVHAQCAQAIPAGQRFVFDMRAIFKQMAFGAMVWSPHFIIPQLVANPHKCCLRSMVSNFNLWALPLLVLRIRPR